MKQRGSMLSLLIGLILFVLAVPAPVLAAVSVGGYLAGNFLWSDKINGSYIAPRSGGATSTPLDTDKDRDNNQFIITAQRSRLWARFTDDVGGVKMSGAIEGDFNTGDGNALTSNSRHLRLRLAYARADHPSGFFLLAGQYSAITTNEDIAFSGKFAIDDVNGPIGGMSGARQPQLRVGWKTPMGPGSELMFEASVEKNSTTNLGSASVDESQGEGQPLPLVGGRVTWSSPIVRVQAGVGLSENTVILAGGKDESDGASVFFANAELIFQPITLFAHVHTQKGLARLTGGAGEFPSAFLVNNKVENVESTGFMAAVKFQLTPDTRINAIYGWHKADEIAAGSAFTGANLETLKTMEINIIHRFWKNWQIAFSFMRNEVEAFNGTEGDNNQVHMEIWYFF